MEANLLAVLCFVFTIFLILTSWKSYGKTKSPKLPGPSTLPIIGSIHHLVRSTPHRCLRNLAEKHGPLMLLRLGEVDHLVVSSKEIAEEVLKTHGVNFAERPLLSVAKILSYDYTGIGTPYGDYWKQIMRICRKGLLSPKQVKSFHSLRGEEIGYLLKEISVAAAEDMPINLSHNFTTLSNAIIFRAVMGKRCQHQQAFIGMVEEIMKLFVGLNVDDFFPSYKLLHLISRTTSKLRSFHRSLDGIVEEIVQEHEEALKNHGVEEVEEEDVVDVLLKHNSGEGDIHLTMDYYIHPSIGSKIF